MAMDIPREKLNIRTYSQPPEGRDLGMCGV